MRNLLKRNYCYSLIVLCCIAFVSIPSHSLGTEIHRDNRNVTVTEENKLQTERQDSIAFVKAKWTEKKLASGAKLRYAQIHLFNSIQSISVLIYPAKHYATHILQADKAGTTSELAKSVNAEFAINGSFFNMDNREPVTFVMVDKQIKGVNKLNENEKWINGILLINQTNNRCHIDIRPYEPNEWESIRKNYTSALVSGPVLMTNHKIPSFSNTKRHPRTIIGTTAKGKEVIMLVIDGRFKGKADGVSFEESATIARYLKMENVLNLDGGGSSTLWTKELGVVNYPCDNHLFDHAGERKVSNIVYVSRVHQ